MHRHAYQRDHMVSKTMKTIKERNSVVDTITDFIMKTAKNKDSVTAVALDLTGPRRIPWFKAIERLDNLRKESR